MKDEKWEKDHLSLLQIMGSYASTPPMRRPVKRKGKSQKEIIHRNKQTKLKKMKKKQKRRGKK